MVSGEIPAAQVHQLQQLLPSLTRGEGVLQSFSESYRPVQGLAPTRSRSGLDPLNRTEYLLAAEGRASRASHS